MSSRHAGAGKRIGCGGFRVHNFPASRVDRIDWDDITAVSALKQRALAQAIKRARFLGLLPYVIK